MPKPQLIKAPKRYFHTIVTGYRRVCCECNELLDLGDEYVFDSEERHAYCLSCGEELKN